MPTITQKKIPIAATISLLLCVLLLCSLGTWQLKRLTWKEDLLAKIDAAQTVDPQSHELHGNDFTAQNEWQRGFVRGTYRNDLAIKIAPRTYNGKTGVHLIVPFVLKDGSTILINRGWFLEGTDVRSESAQVFGMLRLPEKQNRFVPQNDPVENQWYSVDIEAIKTEKNLPALAHVVLYAESETPIASPAPRYVHLAETLPNNHLQYALFWFGMAGMLILFYALRFLRSMPSGDDSTKD